MHHRGARTGATSCSGPAPSYRREKREGTGAQAHARGGPTGHARLYTDLGHITYVSSFPMASALPPPLSIAGIAGTAASGCCCYYCYCAAYTPPGSGCHRGGVRVRPLQQRPTLAKEQRRRPRNLLRKGQLARLLDPFLSTGPSATDSSTSPAQIRSDQIRSARCFPIGIGASPGGTSRRAPSPAPAASCPLFILSVLSASLISLPLLLSHPPVIKRAIFFLFPPPTLSQQFPYSRLFCALSFSSLFL